MLISIMILPMPAAAEACQLSSPGLEAAAIIIRLPIHCGINAI
jgi:hypothetical protein